MNKRFDINFIKNNKYKNWFLVFVWILYKDEHISKSYIFIKTYIFLYDYISNELIDRFIYIDDNDVIYHLFYHLNVYFLLRYKIIKNMNVFMR